MQKADHSGHRGRLRDKYIEHGIDALAEHEVLEMLLFNAIPQRNTNNIAKNLIDRFGSLSAVFDASMDMLTDAGLTRNQAAFIKLIPDVTRLYMVDRYSDRQNPVLDLDRLGFYIINKFIGKEHEENALLLLYDSKGKEIICDFFAQGTAGQLEISIRHVVHMALRYNAASAVIAHNHPSGMATPSQEDLKATRRLKEALALVGVELLDHYIVADRDGCSMTLTGLLD